LAELTRSYGSSGAPGTLATHFRSLRMMIALARKAYER